MSSGRKAGGNILFSATRKEVIPAAGFEPSWTVRLTMIVWGLTVFELPQRTERWHGIAERGAPARGADAGLQFAREVVFAGFLGVAVFLLFTEHRAHVLGFLPWLLLLACPLMHLFMHGGHGNHGEHGDHHH